MTYVRIAGSSPLQLATAFPTYVAVISGESGSGKTENTNFLLHHLTQNKHQQQNHHGCGVEQTLLGAGPVLEVSASRPLHYVVRVRRETCWSVACSLLNMTIFTTSRLIVKRYWSYQRAAIEGSV